LIRQLDDAVVRKLRAKAAAEGISAEEQARRILRRALVGETAATSLLEFLRTMPDAGDDRLFQRRKMKQRAVKL
jgi:hypothetical protein